MCGVLGGAWAANADGDIVGSVLAATLWSELWVCFLWGSIVWSRSGSAWRAWLYWASIVGVGSSVPVVGDGGVECPLLELGGSSLGLVEGVLLVCEAEWQILMSGSSGGGVLRVTWAAGDICGSSACSGPGMACRSWWYWSGVAWVESV
jgi:hypothetical protein